MSSFVDKAKNWACGIFLSFSVFAVSQDMIYGILDRNLTEKHVDVKVTGYDFPSRYSTTVPIFIELPHKSDEDAEKYKRSFRVGRFWISDHKDIIGKSMTIVYREGHGFHVDSYTLDPETAKAEALSNKN